MHDLRNCMYENCFTKKWVIDFVYLRDGIIVQMQEEFRVFQKELDLAAQVRVLPPWLFGNCIIVYISIE